MRQATTVSSHAIREMGTGVFSRAPMTAALTPQHALAYLLELSSDIRAAVVLDDSGGWLAGEAALTRPVMALLASAPGSGVEVITARGGVFAARGASHALGLVTGRFALPALIRHDLQRALGDLDAGAAE